MMKKVATIILNRNLPEPTNALYSHIEQYDGEFTDIYVVEAGSDEDKLSKYCTWHVADDVVKKNGLRYGRGMNYGLLQLVKEKKYYDYDAFFLLTNDAELGKGPSIKPLMDLMDMYSHIGILSPCSKRWGERNLIDERGVTCFWFIHNNAYFVRRELIDLIADFDSKDYLSFLFDGTNFRGYLTEEELIAKTYANDYSAAITNKVWVEENESHLLNHAQLIKTESYDENLKLYIEEGLSWVKKKYGFNNRWTMQQYVRQFYESFFEYHPELKNFCVRAY